MKWSDEEIRLLTETYPTEPLDKIAPTNSPRVKSSSVQSFNFHFLFSPNDVAMHRIALIERPSFLAIDGEGSIRVSKSSKAHGKKLRPQICICNTNLEFLEKIRVRLNNCGWIRNVNYEKRHYKYKGRDKPFCFLLITGVKSVYPILCQIIDELTVKREQALLLKRFCESRLARGYNSPYTAEEINISRQIKALNLRRGNI